MSLRLIWVYCLIIIGAAVALWFLNQHASHTETTAMRTSDTPSTNFSDIEMVINSSKGRPQYKLSSPEYWLYHEERRTEFELPSITIYSNNGSKIFATALRGQTYDDNNVITLIGNVRINQPGPENDSHISKIMTDRLTIHPESQRAITDSPITATRESNIVKASGMTLNLNTQILHLHGNVEGHYEP